MIEILNLDSGQCVSEVSADVSGQSVEIFNLPDGCAEAVADLSVTAIEVIEVEETQNVVVEIGTPAVEVSNLDGGCPDDALPIIVNLDTGEPTVEVFLTGPQGPIGPPGQAGGPIIETLTTDTLINLDSDVQYVMVNALQAIQIVFPLASSRLKLNDGKILATPVTIKNTTGVNITLTPSGSDVLEIISENYRNQSLTLLPRTGGYSAI